MMVVGLVLELGGRLATVNPSGRPVWMLIHVAILVVIIALDAIMLMLLSQNLILRQTLLDI